MTATLDRANGTGPSGMRHVEPGRLPARPGRRRPLLVFASVLLVFSSIAVFATVYSSANHQSAVLVVTSTVQKGQEFTSGVLGQANAAVSGGATLVPVTDASELSGKRASVTIPSGTLLTVGDISSAPAIPPGDAVVGLALKAGQLPAAGLEDGDEVMVMQTGPPGTPVGGTAQSAAAGVESSGGSGGSGGSSGAGGSGGAGGAGTGPTGVLVSRATVFDVEVPPADAGGSAAQLVSVEVSAPAASAVSTAGAADQVALVLIPQGAGHVQGNPGAGSSSGATAGSSGHDSPGGSSSS